MTEFILRPRQAGKTTELIRRADNFNGYIVCPDRDSAEWTFRHAQKIGANIHYPLTFEDLRRRQYHAAGVRKVHIDNIDMLLGQLAPGVDIETCTINDTSPS